VQGRSQPGTNSGLGLEPVRPQRDRALGVVLGADDFNLGHGLLDGVPVGGVQNGFCAIFIGFRADK
jgi:hypothetical protein